MTAELLMSLRHWRSSLYIAVKIQFFFLLKCPPNNLTKATGPKCLNQFPHFRMRYANINLLHQQRLRINYVKSKQSFDVHFESVHT